MIAMALATLVACGEKEESSTSAVEEATESASTVVPADKVSQAYGKRLFSAEITRFKPVDGGGADFVYDDLTFKPDGSWSANGKVTIADESMECKEMGTWTMDPAESESQATLSWTVDKTNCAGREDGTTLRAMLILDKDGSYTVKMR